MRYLDLTLAADVGEVVVIRYDPADLAEIRVYHCNKLLCRAVCQDLADRTISLKEIVHARTQRRLVQRLFAQIACILATNHLSHLTAEVVVAARESLVIGAT